MFSKRSVLSSKNVKKEFVGKIMFNKHRNFKTYFPSVSLMKELWQVVQLEIVFWFQNTPYKLNFCPCVSPVVRLSAHITMGQNQVILRHQKFTFPQAREWAKWARELTSERCERTSGQASGPVLTFLILFISDHSAYVSVDDAVMARITVNALMR